MTEATEAIDLPEQLARDVLDMAAAGGMPNSYFLTDSRIARACEVLGVTPAEALEDWPA